MSGSFLEEPAMTPRVQALYDEDMTEDGYVWNASRLAAYQPETMQQLLDLSLEAFVPSGLSLRQRGILVLAAASARGDSYCSLAWGGKVADAFGTELAAAVLSGSDAGLTEQETVIAWWARKVVNDPNATSLADVQKLRDAGLSDTQVFAITVYVSLRLAIATVNDALGAHPDAKLVAALPPEVAAAVNWGRAPQD
ncbi:MAG TPA: hypothetical protein VGH27_12755 [Streptosporangiaceae bacterium]|jgi:uncharacterized peroxidase-related enzyme